MSLVFAMKTMKFFLSGLFLLLASTAYPQLFTTIQWQDSPNRAASDTIYYNPQSKLLWNDFRGDPDRRSIAAAITASGFGYTMAMRSRGGKATLVLTVYCFFNKQNSWVKSGMKSNYALLHEQHHFDITYIAASSFVKKLKSTSFTLSNYEALLDKLYTDSYNDLEKMQNDYDGQTKNGQLADVQANWNKRVDQQLSSLVID